MTGEMSLCLAISTAIKLLHPVVYFFLFILLVTLPLGQTYTLKQTPSSEHFTGCSFCKAHTPLGNIAPYYLSRGLFSLVFFSHPHAQYKIKLPIYHLLCSFVSFHSNCHQLTSFLHYHFKYLFVCVISSSCDFISICILH